MTIETANFRSELTELERHFRPLENGLPQIRRNDGMNVRDAMNTLFLRLVASPESRQDLCIAGLRDANIALRYQDRNQSWNSHAQKCEIFAVLVSQVIEIRDSYEAPAQQVPSLLKTNMQKCLAQIRWDEHAKGVTVKAGWPPANVPSMRVLFPSQLPKN